MTATDSAGPGFGANSWLVEEMYEQFRSDPGSVSETWREFFSDYKPAIAPAADASGDPRRSPARRPHAAGAAGSWSPAQQPADDAGEPIRGAGAAIAANMERSLVGAHRDELPQRPGQAARGQPQGHQRLPQPQRAGQGQLHPPHRLRRRARHRRRRAEHEQLVRRRRRRQAAPHPQPARQHGPRRRRRQGRRHAHARRARAARRRHARLRRLPRRVRRPHPQGEEQQADGRATSRAPPSRSPTPAPSARCRACRG